MRKYSRRRSRPNPLPTPPPKPNRPPERPFPSEAWLQSASPRFAEELSRLFQEAIQELDARTPREVCRTAFFCARGLKSRGDAAGEPIMAFLSKDPQGAMAYAQVALMHAHLTPEEQMRLAAIPARVDAHLDKKAKEAEKRAR